MFQVQVISCYAKKLACRVIHNVAATGLLHVRVYFLAKQTEAYMFAQVVIRGLCPSQEELELEEGKCFPAYS